MVAAVRSCLLKNHGGERSRHTMTHINPRLSLQGDPVGALVRSCLLEDRGGERSFSYAPPASSGGGYLVKWSFHNVRSLQRPQGLRPRPWHPDQSAGCCPECSHALPSLAVCATSSICQRGSHLCVPPAPAL